MLSIIGLNNNFMAVSYSDDKLLFMYILPFFYEIDILNLYYNLQKMTF